jgi:hypothetical protein
MIIVHCNTSAIITSLRRICPLGGTVKIKLTLHEGVREFFVRRGRTVPGPSTFICSLERIEI